MKKKPFTYQPLDHELEAASNSYLMSLVAIVVGVPLPIINLFATLIFYLGNRRSAYFIRWHCTQALLSQASLFLVNSYAFWWTYSIVFKNLAINDSYIFYLVFVIIFNLVEFVATIYTAIKVRKGGHLEWWFFGSLTNMICKK